MAEERWQLHERHDREVKAVLIANGGMGPRGELRRWTHKDFEAIRRLGHTSAGFETCDCSKATGAKR